MTILTRDWFWYRLLFLMCRAVIAPDEVEVLLTVVDGGRTWRDWQRWVYRGLVLPMIWVGRVVLWLRLRAYTVVFGLAVRLVRQSLRRAIGG